MRSLFLAASIGLLLPLGACQSRSSVAYGDANSIIVAAPEGLWAEVNDTVISVMEPRVLTVRDERTFELTHISPEDPRWAQLRLWRQVLVIGTPGDPWIAPFLEEVRASASSLPAVIERENVWANNQRVTAVVLPEEGAAERLVELLPELHRLFDQRFRRHVQQRMFASGRNDALRDSLEAEAGFSLLLPKVYRAQRPGEAAYLFRNDNSNAGDLDRTILVTWRPGVAEAPTAEAALAWRDSVAATLYEGKQTTGRERVESRALEAAGTRGVAVQGAWRGTDAGYPTAGPFMTRVVACPAQNRTYLLDGWIYAPAKSKYEYMLQLETILDSFGCGGTPATASAAGRPQAAPLLAQR